MTAAQREGYRQALADVEFEYYDNFHIGETGSLRSVVERLRAALDAAPAAPEEQKMAGVPVRVDADMPCDQIRLENARGEVVAAVTGLASPASPGERGEAKQRDSWKTEAQTLRTALEQIADLPRITLPVDAAFDAVKIAQDALSPSSGTAPDEQVRVKS